MGESGNNTHTFAKLFPGLGELVWPQLNNYRWSRGSFLIKDDVTL
jgi:hypothetical protein